MNDKEIPPEMSLEQLADVLSLTIKHDKENKIVTFLAMLSAFTDSSQINISFNAPSSTGKTYLTTEVAKLFPDEDKIELSGASPTSFFYGEADEDPDTGVKTVNLSRKILIFYDQPDPKLQARLRSVLSHDSRELKYRMTNKGKKGENRAQEVVVRGFPATVFCSAGQRLDDQEATRAILLSPETTEDKLRDGVGLQAMRSADVVRYNKAVEADERRQLLKERILAIRDEMVGEIIVPKHEAIRKRFEALAGQVQNRHMRDMEHLMSLIKATALLNVWRRYDGDDVLANQSDIDQAFGLWAKFMESLQLGISPALLNFYRDFILMAWYEKKAKEMESGYFDMLNEVEPLGISRYELSKYHLSITDKPLQEDYLRKEVLIQLENCGLIQQGQPLSGDKRQKYIYPQVFFDEENNIGDASGHPLDDSDSALA